MNYDDVIYMSLLFFCIGFGQYYRNIKSLDIKKWVGTGIGMLIVLVVSGKHAFHTFVFLILGTVIFLFVNPRQCHLVSFVVLFSYLLFFRSTEYFGIPKPPGHTNLIQMILTLKLVGLAFEKNTAYSKKKQIEAAGDAGTSATLIANKSDLKPLFPAEKAVLHLGFIDIIHYTFNYVGVLTGPYFSYRTFYDYWNLPFAENAPSIQETINKIKWVPLYAGLFLLINYIWPISYALEPEFYEQRSFLYRLWYVWPAFFMFRMRIYTGLTLSECVCTMAGFGAYPKQVESRPGNGPTKEYLEFVEGADKLEYDFETIHNIDPYNTDTCWTFREAMKHWNTCIQYWLAMNVYKRFPNKKFRILATLAVSAYWHGVYSGYYLCMLGPAIYLPIEDIYSKLFRENATGLRRRIIDVIFWISKFFAFSYMGIAFLLMSLDKIWFYYGSVYHFGYILWVAMFVIGVAIQKQRPRPKRDETMGKTTASSSSTGDSKNVKKTE